MATDEMYDLAFQYRQVRLWELINGDELFAVRFSDGEIGYCCVMGAEGNHNALTVFVGDAGFSSFVHMVKTVPIFENDTWISWTEHECLQCAFMKREEIYPQEAEEVRSYVRRNGVRMAHRKWAYPRFAHYSPYCAAWSLRGVREELYMYQALQAAIHLAELLDEPVDPLQPYIDPVELWSYRYSPERPDTVPLFLQKDGGYAVKRTHLPKPVPWLPYDAELKDEDLLSRFKHLPARSTLQCALVYQTAPVMNPDTGIPTVQAFLLCRDVESGQIMAMPSFFHSEQLPQQVLDEFARTMVRRGVRPRRIQAGGDRAFEILRDLAGRSGTRITMDEDMPELLAIRDEYLHPQQNQEEEEEES